MFARIHKGPVFAKLLVLWKRPCEKLEIDFVNFYKRRGKRGITVAGMLAGHKDGQSDVEHFIHQLTTGKQNMGLAPYT